MAPRATPWTSNHAPLAYAGNTDPLIEPAQRPLLPTSELVVMCLEVCSLMVHGVCRVADEVDGDVRGPSFSVSCFLDASRLP